MPTYLCSVLVITPLHIALYNNLVSENFSKYASRTLLVRYPGRYAKYVPSALLVRYAKYDLRVYLLVAQNLFPIVIVKQNMFRVYLLRKMCSQCLLLRKICSPHVCLLAQNVFPVLTCYAECVPIDPR